VNGVVPLESFEAELRRVIEKCLAAAPTATRHTKRLRLVSFHMDPRTLVSDVVAAQTECMRAWELDEANRAWDERRAAPVLPAAPGNLTPRSGRGGGAESAARPYEWC
jgi:hypothetical protein